MKEAQNSLRKGDASEPQAIIPMLGSEAGDPHNLAKKWEGGSMWWLNYDQINEMREDCVKSVQQQGIPESLIDS